MSARINIRRSLCLATALTFLPVGAVQAFAAEKTVKYSTTLDNFLNENFDKYGMSGDYFLHGTKAALSAFISYKLIKSHRGQKLIVAGQKTTAEDLTKKLAEMDKEVARLTAQSEIYEKERSLLTRHTQDPIGTMNEYRAGLNKQLDQIKATIKAHEESIAAIDRASGDIKKAAETTVKAEASTGVKVGETAKEVVTKYESKTVVEGLGKVKGNVLGELNSARAAFDKLKPLVDEAEAAAEGAMPASMAARIDEAGRDASKLPKAILDRNEFVKEVDTATKSVAKQSSRWSKFKSNVRILGIASGIAVAVDSVGAIYIVYSIEKDPTMSPLIDLIANKTPGEFADLITGSYADIFVK